MTTLVIGNGFDLDLGMNTRYSDFTKSGYWPKDVSSSSHNLQQYLNERKDMDCWFDLEQCLLDYCKPQRGISFGQDPFDVKLAGDIQSGYRGRPKASVDNDFHLQRNISTSDTQAHT